MEYIDCKEISYCTLFLLEASQDELGVYESCMKYVLKHCDDDAIYEITGCTRGELGAFAGDIRNILSTHVRDELLPDEYKRFDEQS